MSIVYNSAGKAKPDLLTDKSSGTPAVALSKGAKTQKFRLVSVSAHAASNVASALTVTKNDANGSTYDTLLSTNSNWTDLFIEGSEDTIFNPGDTIDVACADNVVVKGVILTIELL